MMVKKTVQNKKNEKNKNQLVQSNIKIHDSQQIRT